MSDHPKSIPPLLVYAETRSAAHQLRSIASRLLTMAALLPLPGKPELDRLLDHASEQTFRDDPILSLYIDLETLVRNELLSTAHALDQAASGVGAGGRTRYGTVSREAGDERWNTG